LKFGFILIILLFVFNACGYKPTSFYAANALTSNVFIKVPIDINNARNSVLIKDALIELIINKFKLKITNKNNLANSFIEAKLVSVSHKELQSDISGYAKVYRETVKIEVKYNKKNQEQKIITVSNYFDFIVNNDSIVTQNKKDEAIKIAINKALGEVFSKIAINSYK
jgi:hypothetical protein